MHTSKQTNKQTNLHTYIHTNKQTYIHTHTHTHIPQTPKCVTKTVGCATNPKHTTHTTHTLYRTTNTLQHATTQHSIINHLSHTKFNYREKAVCT